MKALFKNVSPRLVDIFIPKPSLFLTILQNTRICILIAERSLYEQALSSYEQFHGEPLNKIPPHKTQLDHFIEQRIVDLFSQSRYTKIVKQIDHNLLRSKYFEDVLYNHSNFTKIKGLRLGIIQQDISKWLYWYENNKLLNFPNALSSENVNHVENGILYIAREDSKMVTMAKYQTFKTKNLRLSLCIKVDKDERINPLVFFILFQWLKERYEGNVQVYQLGNSKMVRILNKSDHSKPSFIFWGGENPYKQQLLHNNTFRFYTLLKNDFFESNDGNLESYFKLCAVSLTAQQIEHIPKEIMDWERWSFHDIFPLNLDWVKNSNHIDVRTISEELQTETKTILRGETRNLQLLENVYQRRMLLLSSLLFINNEKILKPIDDEYFDICEAVYKMKMYIRDPILDTKIMNPDANVGIMDDLSEKCVLSFFGISLTSNDGTCHSLDSGSVELLCSGIHKKSPLFVYFEHCKI